MAALLQRHFAILSLGTALLFICTALLANQTSRIMFTSPTVQIATSNISSLALLQVMSTEIPVLGQTVQAPAGPENRTLTSFLLRIATGIHAGDLRSLMGRELPGLLTFQDARVIVPGQGFVLDDLYIESPAPPGIKDVVIEESPIEPTSDPKEEETADTAKNPPMYPTTGTKKVAFVYNTHNRESWLSVAKMNEKTSSVDHPSENISLVGKRFAEALEDKGVGTVFSNTDFYQQLLDQKKSYPLSYAQSLKAIQAAKQDNREMNYFFDLHRDHKSREKTTVTIKGKTYARLMFVIGTRNKHHEQNTAFAKKLHELMEKKYPGLSRGVVAKTENEGNGEYNQSVSPGSLLVEVGGTANTIPESYRAAEALADVFAEYYWQAERTTKETPTQPSKR